VEATPANSTLAGGEARRLLARLEALRAIDQGILRAESPEEIARTALAHLRRLLPARRGAVALWSPWEEATLLAVATEGPTALGPGARLPLGSEPSTAALRQGEVVVYEDLAEHPDPSPTDRLLLAEGIRACLRVPLTAKGNLIGTLSLGAAVPRAFTAEHVGIAREVADQLALALEHARLYQAEQRWRQQLQAVMNLTRDIVGEQSLPALLQDVVGRAVTLTGAHGGVLYLWDEAEAKLVPSAWMNHGAYMQEVRHALGEHLTGAVAANGQGQIWNDYPEHPGHDPRLLRWIPLTACMAAPVRAREQLVGVLTLDQIRPGHRFTPEDLRLLGTLAAQIAIVIENARLYEEKRLAAIQLEAQVEARTRELNAANQALAAANADLAETSRHKSEFLAAMSHELRTPLNAVIGFAEVLQGGAGGPLTERQARYLGHIHNAGKHLLALVSDVVDLARVEAGKFALQPEPLAVKGRLEDLLAIVRSLASKKSQQIQVSIAEGLPPLVADPVRFNQICFNLLSNAVKFTPEGGTITVTARQVFGESENGRTGETGTEPGREGIAPIHRFTDSPIRGGRTYLEIRVADTGVGIRPEDMAKLFREFTQLETTRVQHHEGSGLGLALTRRLVELHGGRIWAESAGEGKGSTFTVLLPFGGPEPGEQEAARRERM